MGEENNFVDKRMLKRITNNWTEVSADGVPVGQNIKKKLGQMVMQYILENSIILLWQINENKFDKTNFHSPTWFFYNKLFKAKICKLKSFGAYKQIKKKLSFTIDTKSDYNFVKNFIKKNNFKPGQDNLCNFYKNK